MDAAQVVEELSTWQRLPVEAIRAAQADRATMIPLFLRRIDEFLSMEGEPAAPAGCFSSFICSASGAKNRRTGRWQLS
jgi:hypothetical protein